MSTIARFPYRTKGPFLYFDREFEEVVGDEPKLVRAVETDAHEGPVWFDDGEQLLFTSVRTETTAIRTFRTREGRVDTVREPSNMANGMTRDLGGALLICEQGTMETPARISRLEPPFTAEPETVVGDWFGLPFNSPNDIVVDREGAIWFTDPDYGHNQGFRPPPQVGSFVYRFVPETGRIDVVADSFDKPNGLAFSADESILYVTDSGFFQGTADDPFPHRPHHVRAFDVADGAKLTGDRLFFVADRGIPDGIKLDTDGRVYMGCADGIQVANTQGLLIGKILVPNGVANFAFGGAERDVLYLLSDEAIWTVKVETTAAVR